MRIGSVTRSPRLFGEPLGRSPVTPMIPGYFRYPKWCASPGGVPMVRGERLGFPSAYRLVDAR
jgi:hypothetical protein